MSKVLITGANGFIGSNLCRHFLAKGWAVQGIVRESSDLHFLRGLDVELIRGDLCDPDRIPIPGDTSYVIHTAALVSDNAQSDECDRNISRLTDDLVRRLQSPGIALRRFVYISTALTLGFNGLGISEANPGESAEFLPYVKHKILTETSLKAMHAHHGFPAVILRPGDVYGPNDRVTSANVLKACERGLPLVVGSGRWRFGYCYVENFCQAVEKSLLTQGIEGQAYTVTNRRLPTWREFFEAMQKGVNKKQRLYVPVWFAFAVAGTMHAFRKFVPGYEPSVNRYRIKRISTETVYDISKTLADLDYAPDDDFERQFDEIVTWYLKERKDGFLD